jgi:hypothetical protein
MLGGFAAQRGGSAVDGIDVKEAAGHCYQSNRT